MAEAGTWFARVRSLLDGLADTDPRATDVVDCLDLGGGYDAACLDDLLWGDFGRVVLAYVHDRLPRCRTVVLEPGKSLVQAYGAVVATVLARQSQEEVCVDAFMAELPWPMSRRPVSVWRQGSWARLPEGRGVIGGRCTAETDVLAAAVDITGLVLGDRLLFADAGAYDWSMRSAFGTATVIETIAASDANP